MNAQEKIIEGILEESRTEAEKVLSNARAEVDAVSEEYKARAKDYSAKKVSEALLRAKVIKQNADSAGEITVRDASLAKKHEEIEKTIALALDKIKALPDEKYFTMLARIAEKYAEKRQGEALLGRGEEKRNADLFAKALKEKGIDVTVGYTNALNDGFILKYGDIEYNLSLSALVDDKRELLEDRINAVLFCN